MALCLLLAAFPAYAKMHGYEEILPGQQIHVDEINGKLNLHIGGYWDDEAGEYAFR